MQGKNEIHMSQATMQEAVQLWLNDQFKEPPTVASVKKDTDTYGAGSDRFIVVVNGTTDGGGK